MNDDSLESIALDLDQLADETAGNETRPSAEDIAARARQAARRVRAIELQIGHWAAGLNIGPNRPVTGPFDPAFGANQPIQATHPRAAAQPVTGPFIADDLPDSFDPPADDPEHERNIAADLANDQPTDLDLPVVDPDLADQS